MYKELDKMISGRETPLTGENEHGERIVATSGENENGKFIEIQTAQDNDWIRINTYYEDGSAEETFTK